MRVFAWLPIYLVILATSASVRAQLAALPERIPTPEEVKQMPATCGAERIRRFSELMPEVAFAELIRKAQNFDTNAMFELSFADNFPIETRQRQRDYWLERAAIGGHSEASLMFALRQRGASNLRLREKHFEIAIASGLSEAMWLYSREICGSMSDRTCGKAVQLLENAAEQGHTFAQQDLCEISTRGVEGFGVNHTKARKWCEIAAWNGCSRAMGYFSILLEKGLGGSSDVDRGRFWHFLMTGRSIKVAP